MSFYPDRCTECAKYWRGHIANVCGAKDQTIRELFDLLDEVLELEGVHDKLSGDLEKRIESVFTYEPFIPR